MRKVLIVVVPVLLAWAGLAVAADNGEEELRRAARLHKAGDTPAAVAIWRSQAQAGNADAAYNLAVIHQHGDGVAKDPGEALKWYRFAAERGDKVSQFQIGLMYQNGDGVPANAQEAHRWFTMNRAHHVHHQHDPRMQQWQRQAAELIAEGDRREAFAASRRDGERLLAELKQRAGTVATTKLDAVPPSGVIQPASEILVSAAMSPR